MRRNTLDRFLDTIDTDTFDNNVQRALFTLLNTQGWVELSSVRVPSAARRLRELRTPQYGGFNVVAKSAVELGLPGTRRTFYYRITGLKSLTVRQLREVFRVA